jgi:hypothetical protein
VILTLPNLFDTLIRQAKFHVFIASFAANIAKIAVGQRAVNGAQQPSTAAEPRASPLLNLPD